MKSQTSIQDSLTTAPAIGRNQDQHLREGFQS
jgi:hypothetical protein